MTPKKTMVLADHRSHWRTALETALTAAPHHQVITTEDGEELKNLLLGKAAHRGTVDAFIVGQQLRGVGAHDVLFGHGAASGAKQILLVSEARSDTELHELFKRRGVTDFIFRDDPIETTASLVLARVYSDGRTSVRDTFRNPVRIDATVRFKDGRAAGSLYDLHQSGAQVIMAADELPSAPDVGDKLQLDFGAKNLSVTVTAEVRRTGRRSSILGDRLVLGVSFDAPDETARANVERVLEFAVQELELARRG